MSVGIPFVADSVVHFVFLLGIQLAFNASRAVLRTQEGKNDDLPIARISESIDTAVGAD